MIILSAGFLWFSWISDRITHDNIHVVHAGLVLLILTVLAVLYKLSLKSVQEEMIPAPGVTLKNTIQTSVEGILNLMRSAIPHHTEDYLPLIAAVFLYIFVGNLLGIIPGLLPPTENISTNLAVALSVFAYYHYAGIKRTGFKNYMGHFFGPSLGEGIWMGLLRLGFLAPLMFVIELISHSVRPVSLTLRLFGNISGDHMVLNTFSDLTPLFIPIVFLAFGIFVSFIQAFVFTLLSTIYVGLAVEMHEEH